MGFVIRHIKRTIKVILLNAFFFTAALAVTYAIMMVRYNRQKAEPEKVRPAPPKKRNMEDIFQELRDIPFNPLKPGFLGLAKGILCNGPVILFDAARPTAAKVFPYPPEFENVTLESFDGTPLSAAVGIHRDGRVRPGLVVTHGIMGSKHQHHVIETALTAYADWGFNVLALDWRNMGESQKHCHAPSTGGWKEGQDILAAAKYLGEMEEVSTVGAMGFSMGAGSVIGAAYQNKDYPYLTGGVVAVNGYTDTRQMVEYISTNPGVTDPFLPVYYFFKLMHFIRRKDMKTYIDDPELKGHLNLPFREADFTRYIAEVPTHCYEVDVEELYEKSSLKDHVDDVDIPLLLLHAEDDMVVPVSEIYKIVEKTASNPYIKIWVLPTGSHCAFRYFDRDWWNSTLESYFSYWGD